MVSSKFSYLQKIRLLIWQNDNNPDITSSMSLRSSKNDQVHDADLLQQKYQMKEYDQVHKTTSTPIDRAT